VNIQKAIENVKDIQVNLAGQLDADDLISLQLLIEAGKRCALARKETSFVGPGLLPGETDD